jgi:hypothetical protein
MNLEPKPAPKRVLTFGETPPKPEPGPPATQPPNLAVQLPEPATQTASPEIVKEPENLGNQIPSHPNTQYVDGQFPSRIQRRQKSIRLPVSKLPSYEDYQHANRHVFRDFQDLVEYALDWVTSRPVTQLPNLPNTQPATLINKELNNSLSFNEEKAARDMATYSRLTGNPAKPKDWEAYTEIAHIESTAVEQGIKDAIQRARQQGRPVLGFRWCIFAIQDAARSSAKPAPSAPELCDLCRDMNGMVYGDPAELPTGRQSEGEGCAISQVQLLHPSPYSLPQPSQVPCVA